MSPACQKCGRAKGEIAMSLTLGCWACVDCHLDAFPKEGEQA